MNQIAKSMTCSPPVEASDDMGVRHGLVYAKYWNQLMRFSVEYLGLGAHDNRSLKHKSRKHLD